MLDDLTKDAFLPLLDSVFRLAEDELELELRLVEVEARWGKGPKREPFSLHFLGPQEPVLPQKIYRLEHEQLGELEIFLVPVGRSEAGIRYEAAFA
jgi:hypothetical protein